MSPFIKFYKYRLKSIIQTFLNMPLLLLIRADKARAAKLSSTGPGQKSDPENPDE